MRRTLGSDFRNPRLETKGHMCEFYTQTRKVSNSQISNRPPSLPSPFSYTLCRKPLYWRKRFHYQGISAYVKLLDATDLHLRPHVHDDMEPAWGHPVVGPAIFIKWDPWLRPDRIASLGGIDIFLLSLARSKSSHRLRRHVGKQIYILIDSFAFSIAAIDAVLSSKTTNAQTPLSLSPMLSYLTKAFATLLLSWAFWRLLRRFIEKSPLSVLPGPPSSSLLFGEISLLNSPIGALLSITKETYQNYITLRDGTFTEKFFANVCHSL